MDDTTKAAVNLAGCLIVTAVLAVCWAGWLSVVTVVGGLLAVGLTVRLIATATVGKRQQTRTRAGEMTP